MASKTGQRATLTTTPATLYKRETSGEPCTTFTVINTEAGGGSDALIRVVGLHKSTEPFPVPPGATVQFAIDNEQLDEVLGSTGSGTAAVCCGITARRSK